MSDWSKEFAPLLKWLVIVGIGIVLSVYSPEIYHWIKTEALSWIREIKK